MEADRTNVLQVGDFLSPPDASEIVAAIVQDGLERYRDSPDGAKILSEISEWLQMLFSEALTSKGTSSDQVVIHRPKMKLTPGLNKLEGFIEKFPRSGNIFTPIEMAFGLQIDLGRAIQLIRHELYTALFTIDAMLKRSPSIEFIDAHSKSYAEIAKAA